MKASHRQIPWTAIYISVVIVTLVATFIAWSVIGRLVLGSDQTGERALASLETSQLRTRIEHQATVGSHIVHGFTAVLSTEPDMEQERFAQLAHVFLNGHDEVNAIFAAPDLVVSLAYPLDLGQPIMGMRYEDLSHLHSPDASLNLDDRGVLVGPIDFLDGGRGFIDRSPIYLSDAEGEFYLWGILSSVILEQAFFDAIGINEITNYELALRSVDTIGSAGQVFYGSESVFDENPVMIDIHVPGGTWQLAAIPVGGWGYTNAVDTGLMGGFVLGGLVLLIFGFLITYLAQQRLQADARLGDAINSMEDGFAFFDAQDRLVTCNDKYKSYYKVSEDLFVPGNKFGDILRAGIRRGQYPEAIGREQEWFDERMMRHHEGGTSFEQKLADGRWLKIAETRSPDGGSVGFRVDITELKLAQQEAERANRAKTDFLNVMSHELRTPLTVVLGFAKFVANPDLLPSVQALETAIKDETTSREEIDTRFDALRTEFSEYGNKIDRSGQHLLSLINDMLDLAKIEAAKMEVEAGPVAIDPVIASVAEQFQDAAGDKGVAIVHEESGESIIGDELRLRQMLINLVGNAVKFTDQGEIRLWSRVQGQMVEVLVSDTGCGIPSTAIDAVFERFNQADASITRRAGGTGLGLAVTKRFAELMGGEVRVNSVEGEGSTFSFTLPRAT